MKADNAVSIRLGDAPRAAAGQDHSEQRPLSLRLNFSWMFAANVVYAACQWAILSLLAKLGTPVMVGQFVLALAITTPLMAFYMLQLRIVLATDARKQFQYGDYLALRILTILPALLTLAAILAFSGYRAETTAVIFAVAFSAAIDSFSDIFYGLLQRHERMDRIARSMIVKAVLSLVAFVIALLATSSVVYAILAIAGARVVVLLACDLPYARRTLREASAADPHQQQRLRPHWRARTLWKLTKLSLPMGLVMMLIVVSASIPRYFVEHFMDEYALGIFGAIGYLWMVGIMAIRALGDSATSRMAELFAFHRTREFLVLLAKLSTVGAVIGVAGVLVSLLAGRQLLTIIYGPEYAEHTNVLIWTMVAAAISYVSWFVGHSLTTARLFRVQIPLNLFVVAATVAACWWLVPAFGLLGAAWSLSITALTQLVCSSLVIGFAAREQWQEGGRG